MSAATVAAVFGREILDSRGRPTVQADVRLSNGAFGRASVPSGASTGRHEKLERRDGGDRYGGLGVRDAVAAVEGPIRSALAGRPADRSAIDALMIAGDGTADRSRYGANAILAVSLAMLRAAAADEGLPVYRHLAGTSSPSVLPLPMVNLLSGGRHARHAMDVQDVLVVPLGASCFSEALEWACDVHRATGRVLEARGALPSGLADEGGYGVRMAVTEALELTVAAIEHAGHAPGKDVAIAVDVAASQLYDAAGDRYRLDGTLVDAAAVVERALAWVDAFPIVSIEDLLHEDDWEGWRIATRALGPLQLVGDDLFVTDVSRLRRGIADGAGNAVLVKPNQIGTISETQEVVEVARAAGFQTIVSARSGETEDGILADVAVGLGAPQIKVGSVTGSERLAKYNRLLEIEHELDGGAVLASPFT